METRGRTSGSAWSVGSTRGYFSYFQSGALVDELKQVAHGSVFDTITRATLEGLEVRVPPPHLVRQFEDETDPVMQRIRVTLDERHALASILDRVLPRLLAGGLEPRPIRDVK